MSRSCASASTRSSRSVRLVASLGIVVTAHFGVLGMVITPTCHVSEGEKDEDVVAVVPVEALNLVVPDLPTARNVRAGKNVPLHMFPLARTALGSGILGFDGVALLYVDARIELRKALARFWARGDASVSIERSMRQQIGHRPLEALE